MRLALWVSRLDATKPASSILSNMACTLRSACGPSHISRRLDGHAWRSTIRAGGRVKK